MSYSPGFLFNIADCADTQHMFESWERELLRHAARTLINRQELSADTHVQVERLVDESAKFRLHVHNDAIDGLSAASLAAFEMPAGLRSLLLDMGNSCTLGNLRRTDFRSTPDRRLARMLGSDQNRSCLREAFASFETLFLSWKYGIRRSAKARWILPEQLLLSPLSLDCASNGCEIIHHMESDVEKISSSSLPPITQWLPYISIELVRTIKGCQSERYHLIRELLYATSAMYFEEAAQGPWDSNFPETHRTLPVHWLYQLSPSDKARRLIVALTAAQCNNVGHLVPFQQSLFTLLKRSPIEYWYQRMLDFKKWL